MIPADGGGLFDALKTLAATLLETGKTRLELIANEVEEEKQRALDLVLTAQAMAFCVAATLLLGVLFLVAVFWESRLLVLGAAVLVFLGLSAFFVARLKRALQRPEHVFAASISELQNDIRALKAAAGYEPPTQ